MNGVSRHAGSLGGRWAAEPVPGRPRSLTRLGVTAAVAATIAAVTMAAAVQSVSTATAAADDASGAVTYLAGGPAAVPISAPGRAASFQRGQYGTSKAPGSSSTGASGRQAATPLTLTAADHRDCPAAATACVDLARHLTWLQSDGTVTFGPVQMEPGKPGSAHPTPTGTFRVQWKAGPSFVSDIYHEAMPWATFFAAGGIAFHGGSLAQWSHGCVHLAMASAHYYNVHLPLGAEVIVF
jgi:hypothetical protein